MSNEYSSTFEIDREMRAKIKDHFNNKFREVVEALKDITEVV